MDGERRKTSNGDLRRVVMAGHCMEFALDQLVTQGSGHVLTGQECQRLRQAQAAWEGSLTQLRREAMGNVVNLPVGITRTG